MLLIWSTPLRPSCTTPVCEFMTTPLVAPAQLATLRFRRRREPQPCVTRGDLEPLVRHGRPDAERVPEPGVGGEQERRVGAAPRLIDDVVLHPHVEVRQRRGLPQRDVRVTVTLRVGPERKEQERRRVRRFSSLLASLRA
jgi:hypothetical protein